MQGRVRAVLQRIEDEEFENEDDGQDEVIHLEGGLTPKGSGDLSDPRELAHRYGRRRI